MEEFKAHRQEFEDPPERALRSIHEHWQNPADKKIVEIFAREIVHIRERLGISNSAIDISHYTAFESGGMLSLLRVVNLLRATEFITLWAKGLKRTMDLDIPVPLVPQDFPGPYDPDFEHKISQGEERIDKVFRNAEQTFGWKFANDPQIAKLLNKYKDAKKNNNRDIAAVTGDEIIRQMFLKYEATKRYIREIRPINDENGKVIRRLGKFITPGMTIEKALQILGVE